MADFGIKISSTGNDVKTATAAQLQYSSKWGNFKIHSIISQTITLTGVSTTGNTTIGSPLSYSPMYFPYVNCSTIANKYRLGQMAGTISMPDDYNWSGVVCNYRPGTNDFYLQVTHTGSGTRVFTFKIVVFVDTFNGTGGSITSASNYGAKISKTSYGLLATDDHMSMTSKFQNLTVSSSGIATTTSPATQTNYAHGLSYVPIYLAFWDSGSGYYPIPDSRSAHSSTHHIETWASSTNIYFEANCSGSINHNFKYLIFNEQLV